jgi:hypothetical protein
MNHAIQAQDAIWLAGILGVDAGGQELLEMLMRGHE